MTENSFLHSLITVVNELEGLSRGSKLLKSAELAVASLSSQHQKLTSSSLIGSRDDPKHSAFVAQASKNALCFLQSKNPAVKYVTNHVKLKKVGFEITRIIKSSLNCKDAFIKRRGSRIPFFAVVSYERFLTTIWYYAWCRWNQ